MSRHSRSFWSSLATIGAVVLMAVTIVAPAFGATYTINSTVIGPSAGAIKGVPITVSGGTLAAPVTGTTNSLGKFKFLNLEAGVYTVTPDRIGWAYLPQTRTVTAGGTKLKYPALFQAKKLKAIGTMTADPTALDLPPSVGASLSKGFVIVDVKDGAGNPIFQAPVTAVATAGVAVSPLSQKTNSFGQALFTVTAGDDTAAGTVTFTSGGWRANAPVRTASTAFTVSAGLAEAILWSGSGHADAGAEAFNHWNEEGSIPTTCAKCHSTPGFLDFLGADGTAAGTVDNPAVIDCAACHNSATPSLTSVTFPSGKTVTGLGNEAACLQCHQGTMSKVGVDTYLGGRAADTVDSTISFSSVNPHYFLAGATQYGTQAQGGYEYDGNAGLYGWKFLHPKGTDTCIDCHEKHSSQVRLSVCQECHAGISAMADLRDIRMPASLADYDGDGNTTEGIAAELSGLAALLYSRIQTYALANGGAIVYDGAAYPYWFKPGGSTFGNRYAAWTPSLLKAAYNYQFYLKDPGAYAHNAKYVIELLYDSIADLGGSVSGLVRDDSGHFNPTSMAFRDWDGDVGGVSASCSRCHSGSNGFDYYLQNGFTNPTVRQAVVTRMDCDTCHTGYSPAGSAPRKYVSQVIFPGDAANTTTIYNSTRIYNSTSTPDDSFVCMTCHQGRQSNGSVRKTLGTLPVDTIDTSLSVSNVHYAATGGSVYGTTAKVAYEYSSELGATYAGFFKHASSTAAAKCSTCHGVDAARHEFFPSLTATCILCHDETTAGAALSTIRKDRGTDYNDNGNITEPLKDELDPIAAALLTAIQAEATANGFPLDFDPVERRWYEAGTTTTYAHWTPRMFKAAFNYNFYVREPGFWAHNTDYIAQILYDSIDDVGGDPSVWVVPGRPLP
jgi:hypothetical protein